MIFATPLLAIAGAIAIVLPIAIHFFFRRRKKPIEWAAMDLLLQAIQQTTRRRHLEKLTLLVLRCLVVVFAGVAIAGPLLQNDKTNTPSTQNGSRELVLIIDDGISQQTICEGRESFLTSQAKAIAAIDELQPGDRVGLLLAAGARQLVWPPTTDIAAARSILVSTEVTDTTSNISGAIEIASDTTQSLGVVSEFRRGSIAHNLKSNTTKINQAKTFLTSPNQIDVSNTQIIAFDPQAKGPLSIKNGIPLRIKLHREGGRLGADQSQISITSDDNNQLSLSHDWKEGQVEAVLDGTLVIQDGRRTEIALLAELLQKDSQPADNSRFTIVPTTNTIHIGVVDRTSTGGNDKGISSDVGVGAWVERALRPMSDAGIETELIEPTAMSTQRCRGLDAVIILRPDALDAAGWGVLSQAFKVGLVVVVVPPPQPSSGVWQDMFLRAFDFGWSISRESTKSDPPLTLRRSEVPHSLLTQLSSELQQLIQPINVSQWLNVSVPVNRGETVLTMENNAPFIVRGTTDGSRGSVLFFVASPELSWTNLPAKPFMVPLFQELIRQSIAQVEQGRQTNVGSDHLPNTIPGAISLKISLGRAGVVADEQRIISVDPNGTLSQPITLPGVYTAVDESNKTVGWVIANIDPSAASTQPTSPEEIANEFQDSLIVSSNTNLANDVTSTLKNSTGSKDQTNILRQETPVARAFQGTSIAVWFFSALLIFLLGETWLARRSSMGATTTRTTREHP
jgi:hypothetical protein